MGGHKKLGHLCYITSAKGVGDIGFVQAPKVTSNLPSRQAEEIFVISMDHTKNHFPKRHRLHRRQTCFESSMSHLPEISQPFPSFLKQDVLFSPFLWGLLPNCPEPWHVACHFLADGCNWGCGSPLPKWALFMPYKSRVMILTTYKSWDDHPQAGQFRVPGEKLGSASRWIGSWGPVFLKTLNSTSHLPGSHCP